jgi:3-hydroxybutyryl-CoA dehydrogenase
MDLTGVRAYHAVMKDLLPTLARDTAVPRLIEEVVAAGGEGISNGKGFYDYTDEEARQWKEVFRVFSYEIRELALRYPEDVVARRMEREKEGPEKH